jgi:hypothetical protein
MCDRRFRSSGYELEGAEHRGAKPSEHAKVSLRLRGEGDPEEKRNQTKIHWFMRMGGGWEDKVYRRVRGKMEARGKRIWANRLDSARLSNAHEPGAMQVRDVWLTKSQLNVR